MHPRVPPPSSSCPLGKETEIQLLCRSAIASGYLPAIPPLIDALIEAQHDEIAQKILTRWNLYSTKLRQTAEQYEPLKGRWPLWAIARETEMLLNYVRKLVIPVVGEAWMTLADVEMTLRATYARYEWT